MKPLIKYPLIFLAAFFAAGSIAYFSVTLFTKSAEVVILPELKGKNILYVLETLTRMGLNAKLYGTQYDDAVPRYAVISQDPAPGSSIKKGRDVIIYISKGRKENIMPDLRHTNLDAALISLEKEELKKGITSYAFSADTPEGRIIAQYPAPFATVLKGSACDILISRGAAPTRQITPDLSGMKLAEAAEKIKQLGLSLASIRSGKQARRPAGVVLSHEPPPGAFATRQDPFILIVNDAEADKEMDPDTLNRLVLVSYRTEPGFLNRRIRIETDMFGPVLALLDDFTPPGETVSLMIPSGEKGFVRIYVDDALKKTITFDPWKQETATGDYPWELLPLQSYLQILHGLETN